MTRRAGGEFSRMGCGWACALLTIALHSLLLKRSFSLTESSFLGGRLGLFEGFNDL